MEEVTEASDDQSARLKLGRRGLNSWRRARSWAFSPKTNHIPGLHQEAHNYLLTGILSHILAPVSAAWGFGCNKLTVAWQMQRDRWRCTFPISRRTPINWNLVRLKKIKIKIKISRPVIVPSSARGLDPATVILGGGEQHNIQMEAPEILLRRSCCVDASPNDSIATTF